LDPAQDLHTEESENMEWELESQAPAAADKMKSQFPARAPRSD
jgi:hypothetical protein